MIKVIQGCLVLLGLTFLSGCATKPEVVIKKEYIKEKPFVFTDIDSTGMTIDAGSKELQRVCTLLVLEAGYKYRKIIDLYEFQIAKYRELHDVRTEK